MSRYLVIALAFIAAGIRFTQGAWVEAAGLAGLGGGLAALRFGGGRPAARYLAITAFATTAVAIAVMLIRRAYGS